MLGSMILLRILLLIPFQENCPLWTTWDEIDAKTTFKQDLAIRHVYYVSPTS